METIKWAVNEMPKTDDSQLQVMSLENVAKARAFHESFPQYSVTPLVKLDHMAAYLGLKEVYVKDESYRFGLNAFKVLGGSFATLQSRQERMFQNFLTTFLHLTNCVKNSDRLLSSLQQMVTTDVVLHGQRTSLDRKL